MTITQTTFIVCEFCWWMFVYVYELGSYVTVKNSPPTKYPSKVTKTSCAGGRHNMSPPPPASWQYLRIYSPGGTCSGMLTIWDTSNKLIFDLLTLKVISESRVMWAISVPILVFLGLSVLELGLMYATDRCRTDRCQTSDKQTDVRQKHRLMPPPYGGGGIINGSSRSQIRRHIPDSWAAMHMSRPADGWLLPVTRL